MIQNSQSVWKHGIIPDPSVLEPRVSLTFRWLVDPDNSQPKDRPPPISEPNISKVTSVRPQRILFLTDSIHSGTPEHIFETLPNHVCIKQKEFQLRNIDNYCDQFEYTDVAVL